MRCIIFRTRRAYLLLGVAVAGSACAREEMPPGTGPDFEPPAVVEMFPVSGSAVPDLDEDAYVKFDEPLGDPRSLARVIETSPAWRYDINAGRRTVRIRPIDGWRPGVVYTFRIPPGVRDLVRNTTREPIDLVFTTGPEFFESTTGGTVWDRETVRKVRDIAVQVVGEDSIPYAAVTDTGGNFAFRGLPIGDYWAFAFRDQNRNRTLERDFEPHDSGRVSLSDSTTIAQLELWLTSPDSTAPLLGSVSASDSLHLRLEFDDLLEPDASLDGASVNVVAAETGDEWPVAEFAVGDLAAALGPEDGEGAVEPDSLAGEVALEDAEVIPVLEEGRARPQRFVSVRLERPLAGGEYDVSARGFPNLRLLAGGGDTTFVYEPPPPVPEEDPEAAAGEEGREAEEDGSAAPESQQDQGEQRDEGEGAGA
jgi:hypothetical protein